MSDSCDSMDYSPPGSSVFCPWGFPGKNTGVGCLQTLKKGVLMCWKSDGFAVKIELFLVLVASHYLEVSVFSSMEWNHGNTFYLEALLQGLRG